MNHLTIATSSGIVWLTLITHFAAGLTGLVAGTIALSVSKGGQLHKQSGMVFTYAMITVGVLATILYAIEGKSILGGLFPVYLIFTAVTTVKPIPRGERQVDIAFMLLAFVIAAGTYLNGVIAWQAPRHMVAGVPAQMIFFIATVTLLAALGDARMIRDGGIRGTRRIARHLWRMCFGLFIATGSFFLGQLKFIPAPIRIVPVLFLLAIAPLLVLLYWMWRVRFRHRLSGLVITGQAPSQA